MCDTCNDNRFELIEKYKKNLLDATNIGDSPEEMAVIDNILFRFWQMGWLKKLELFGNSEQLDDTISRQAAISICDNAIDLWNGQLGTGALVAVRDAIMALPSAQPERKKGKWLPDNNNYYEERFICSVCGKSYKVDTCMGKPIWDFCPNCGARLDGKDGDG